MTDTVRQRPDWQTWPNLITLFRFVLIPVFVGLVVAGHPGWALVSLVVLGVSDWADGFIARTFDQGSKLGKALDPVADRLAIIAIVLSLVLVGLLPLWVVIALTSVAAIAGNLTGYAIGYKAGPAIFNKPESRLFKAEHVEKAAHFFGRFGPVSLILARFVPIVRTFITAMIAYSWGHPSLDAYRPVPLDRPLQSFYADVNATARDGRLALATLDDARCMRYLTAYMDRIGAQLRSAF